jgi:hypothetical protein
MVQSRAALSTVCSGDLVHVMKDTGYVTMSRLKIAC